MNCRWTTSITPRIVSGRHLDDCADRWSDDLLGCRGCLPCTEPHCRVCRRVHASGTCAECLAAARADLREIARLCDELPEEVEHRGIEGEAMMLLGPVAEPEQWRQRGRYGTRFHVDQRLGEDHPLWVLGTWDMLYREELDHVTHESLTMAAAVNYLDGNLSYLADYGDVPFEDFARDLRQCVGHLEAVLHEGEQRDTGAPCMTCRVPLERVWGKSERADGWQCPRCKRTSTEDQYRFAVMNLHRDEATHLTDREMELRTGVKAGTVRVWANRGDVERKRESGRTVYSVADVLRRVYGEAS